MSSKQKSTPKSQTLSIPNNNTNNKPFLIQTPCYIIHTNKGCVPNITPDLLQETLQLTEEQHILNLNVFDLYIY